MTKHTFSSFLLVLILSILTFSCENHERYSERMDAIRRMGDTVPMRAMKSLDTLCAEMEGAGEHDQQLLALLRVRLQDKADMIPESDLQIKPVMEYFEEKGNNREKQEAYYYAASVYRDLRDYPSAITYFQKSLDYGQEGQGDSLLMRNAYSQLNLVYSRSRNFREALWAAEKELEIAKALNLVDAITIKEIARGYYYINKKAKAKQYCKRALNMMKVRKDDYRDLNELSDIILLACQLKDAETAGKGLQLMEINAVNCHPHTLSLLYADYNMLLNNEETALRYYRECLEDSLPLEVKHDAAYCLFRICRKRGNDAEASMWAEKQLTFADSLIKINNTEESRKAHNQYLYNRERIQEQKEQQRTSRMQNVLLLCIIGACAAIILAIIGVWLTRMMYGRKERRHYESIRQMNKRMQREKKEIEKRESNIRATIAEKEREFSALMSQLQEAEKEEASLRQKLEEKELLNKRLLQQQSKSVFFGSTEEIVKAVATAANGKYVLTENDWEKLTSAIDNLYPNFMKTIILQHPQATTDMKRFFRLIKIGLNSTQIQNLTKASRTTVWRWTKKYEEIVGELATEDTEGE